MPINVDEWYALQLISKPTPLSSRHVVNNYNIDRAIIADALRDIGIMTTPTAKLDVDGIVRIRGGSPGVAGDRHKIGWISDDVQRFFPKAVDVAPFRQEKYRKTKSPDGAEEYIPDGAVEIPDCKYMNTDQIYAATFGAVKKLIQIVESQQKEIEALKKQIDLKN